MSSVRLFSVGFNGFVAKRMPEEMIYEKCLMSNQALSIFEAVMENEHSTPEGRAYAACGLWEKKEADKIKLKQEYNELSVTVLIGDMLRKEPLGNIVRNIILNGCN
ncbi:MchS3 family protein [Erwinia mallotivora]|uniref:MchS3 family protein n=1 Tax=Erwinia mallotivora TaxID=69222 RepID=UPI0023EC3717|nr:MchS3 family protein [Erwinia mallotivora]